MALLPGRCVALLPARPVDLRAQGEGVVEYPGKVACPSGRRCSTRNAVWCHSHPGFKSQRYRHCRPAPLGPGGFVMPERVCPRVSAACCCLWLRWCSGRRRPRPPARSPHASFARSGRSRSPPVPSGPSGALHTSGAGSLTCACALSRSPARPRHRPRAPQPGPSRPSGALHTGGTWCVDVWLGASARCPGRPRRRPRAPQPVSYLNPISGSQP